MENKMILCLVNEFDMQQKIAIIDNNKVSLESWADVGSLGQAIAEMCANSNINNIHMIGNEEYISQKIVPDIYEYSLLTYGNTNLKVSYN